jgi:hypothetical protein
MLKLLKWLGLTVIGVVAVLATIGFALPPKYRIERTIVIAADTERIHELVGDLKQWPNWTLWHRLDPTLKIVYGEKTSGVGARQVWNGSSGNGELTFTKCDRETGVVYDLFFERGRWKSLGEIAYSPSGDQTTVTWSMSGDFGLNLPGRFAGMMMRPEVEQMFDLGLRRLKQKAEEPPHGGAQIGATRPLSNTKTA